MYVRIQRLRQLTKMINDQCAQLDVLTDRQIRDRSDDFRESLTGVSKMVPDQKLILAFSLAKQAAKRTLGYSHYDEQLMAGAALASGSVAEMQTGEGKTLTSTLPTYLSALSGKGIHVATVNSYLAKRDYETLSPLYKLLGLSVGLSESGESVQAKRKAYEADITYSTGYELGFDFLRDQIAKQAQYHHRTGSNFLWQMRGQSATVDVTQTGQKNVLIDEVDSVLIDEATTPLVISHKSQKLGEQVYRQAARTAECLTATIDFKQNESERTIEFTAAGVRRINQDLCLVEENFLRPWIQYVQQALAAQKFYYRDQHYVIRDDKVMIVDEFTGRIFEDRTWREGLHQAIESKENVPVTEENRSVARISRQCYFRLYDQVCGMTGTAGGSEKEFSKFYSLPVVPIPLRLKSRRVSLPTLYFKTRSAKFQAIAEQVIARHRKHQPILVGTRTIADSFELDQLLQTQGITTRLLNGLQDQNEAEIVAQAGQIGAVTIATNMAGRGTDIKLAPSALELGGLHVIATERHLSHRIDLQLAGRSGRQGQPGSVQFFVCPDDKLLKDYSGQLAKRVERYSSKAGGTECRQLDRRILNLQYSLDRTAYQIRKELLHREIWLNEFRKNIA